MARTLITKNEFDSNFTLAAGFGNSSTIRFTSRIFDFDIKIEPIHRDIIFKDCEFQNRILFCKGQEIITVTNNIAEQEDIFSDKETNVFKEKIEFKTCEFQQQVQFDDIEFNNKFIMHDCTINAVSFRNTSFNDLADFWSTTFKEKVIFYKTDFNASVVFSMAAFQKNVLFTYTLFASKTIFSRTRFLKGLDLSQAIISGELKPFDLHFDFKRYKAVYVGNNDKTYQDYIDNQGKIPLVNKVNTFQVLKKAFVNIGNYADSITMQREEKSAFRVLTKERLKEKKVNNGNKGDKFILWLNRWSNNYQSDFRNGIWFTLIVTIIFGTITLIFTQAFQNNICFCGCEFNEQAFTKGIRFLFNFLNPTRSLTYLDSLNPTFGGFAYLFDFLGRLAVGYGFYQTVQAFRKFK